MQRYDGLFTIKKNKHKTKPTRGKNITSKYNTKPEHKTRTRNLLQGHGEQETYDNEPTQTANKRGLIKGTNQEGTGGTN